MWKDKSINIFKEDGMDECLRVPIHKFVSEPDAAWIEQQLLARIRGMERQGLEPRIIVRALARALFSFCLNLHDNSKDSRLWVREFLRATGRTLIDDEEFIGLTERWVLVHEKYLKNTDPAGSA
ncbi:hypothetical protein [Pseudomonas hunanensis]|uniref:hypothetical protein n=1 Tax=Pseudomonas hunanensis TaxID=1247546 RepID=UPI002AA0AF3A|nr:hypothetical protein [Pseudomonas hunanensis]